MATQNSVAAMVNFIGAAAILYRSVGFNCCIAWLEFAAPCLESCLFNVSDGGCKKWPTFIVMQSITGLAWTVKQTLDTSLVSL